MARLILTNLVEQQCRKSTMYFSNRSFLTLSLFSAYQERKLHSYQSAHHQSKRAFLKVSNNVIKCNSLAFGSSVGILKSPLQETVEIPNVNVVDYIFKDADKRVADPCSTCGSGGRSYTYGMMRMLVTKFAQALIAHCKMQPKDVIGLLLPNIPEFIITCHGALEAGMVVTFVNPLYTPDEIKRQFENANVKVIITVPQLMPIATVVAPQLTGYKTTICVGGEDEPDKNIHGLQSLVTAGYEVPLPQIDPNDLAILPYSSGTTGLPKGVMLTHRNLVSNLVQGTHPALFNSYTKDGKPQTIFTVLPYFHIYGFNGILNSAVRDGTHIISIPRFTPEEYLKVLLENKPTMLLVVPSLLLFLATHPAVKKEHLDSIECIMSGAAPLTEGLLEKFRRKIDRQQVDIRQGYGMTESSPVTFMMPKLTPASKLGTIGVLLPGTEAKVISLTNGESLGSHKSGELLIRGPQVMAGYLKNDKATKETIDEEGWLHTGDVGYYDEDRYFYIVDRCKELIKVKGNQVSPTELENILMEMPGVADVAIVGIPDDLCGEVPRAFIVKSPTTDISEEAVCNYVHPKVAHYKKLAGGVKFVKSIPRNPSGKILRQELKIIQ